MSDNIYVNFEQPHELNAWLDRNGYRETKENRDLLKIIGGLVKTYYDKESYDWLRWNELDKYHANNPSEFYKLEKK